MLKRLFLVTLSALVLNLATAPFALASGNAEKEARFAEKVKANILKLGKGPDARVELKLKDGTKLKGFVSDAGDEDFVVTSDANGQAVTVLYPQVKQVKGNNLTQRVKFVIYLGIFISIMLILLSTDKS